MIEQLRRKYICSHMALATIILVGLLLLLVLSFFFYQTSQVFGALDSAVQQGTPAKQMKLDMPGENGISANSEINTPDSATPEQPVEDGNSARFQYSYPTFVVEIDSEGEIIKVTGINVEVSDDLALESVESALGRKAAKGILWQLQLAYCALHGMPGHSILVFLNIQEVTRSFIVFACLCILAVCGAMVCCYFFVRRSAASSLRPVETAWKQQRQFIADASHELKTPITVILANTDIMLAHPEKSVEDQSKWLEHIRSEAMRMQELVTGMMYLARADSNQQPMTKELLSLTELVYDCVLPFEPVAFESGLVLDYDVAQDISVTGDSTQLKQLVMILLDNACKYTPSPGKIDLQLERCDAQARLTVHNSGPAIPAEDLVRIFERFYRADKSRTRQSGGSGLGLSIAQSIVDAHGGHISVKSTEGAGTEFTVLLPLAADPPHSD